MSNLVIVGAAGTAEELVDFLSEAGVLGKKLKLAGFYDENRVGAEIINDLESLPEKAQFLMSVGDIEARTRLFEAFKNKGCVPYSFVADGARVSSKANLGGGVCVYPGSQISVNVDLGDNVFINYNCSISHDVQIGDHSNLCPGVNVAGNVQIGSKVFIGVGATILNGVTICDGAFVGAHSLVKEDITQPGRYVGVPCRKLKQSSSQLQTL